MALKDRKISSACAAAGLLVTTLPHAQEGAGTHASGWVDIPVTRLEALALLETLNADLLSNDSATLTLDRWCDAHKMATPAKIVAERVHDGDKVPTEEVRQLLGLSPGDPVRYRHVRLHCGAHVLSEADNWYVPARLTPDMNRELDTTDIAFGRAVQALHFHRHTLSARLLWEPLPGGWERGASLPAGPATSTGSAAGPGPAAGTGRAAGAGTGAGAGSAADTTLQIPAQTIEHRAVLSLPDGTPFSVVVETYTNEVLSFPQPPRS